MIINQEHYHHPKGHLACSTTGWETDLSSFLSQKPLPPVHWGPRAKIQSRKQSPSGEPVWTSDGTTSHCLAGEKAKATMQVIPMGT